MDRGDITAWAWDILESEITEQGYELVEVEYGTQNSRKTLRLFIDKEGGVTIDDCAELSRYLSAYLDVQDILSSEYVLEVSSPGIDRPIRKKSDFERFKGEEINVQTVSPVEGRRRFRGVLTGFDDGLISVEGEGAVFRIHIENVRKARLDR